MYSIPEICLSQACPNVDLFYILPNLIVGSYPVRKKMFQIGYQEDSLTEILKILSNKYKKTLIINLVVEKKPYYIEHEYINYFEVKCIQWNDYSMLALQDFIDLVYYILNFMKKRENGIFIHCKHGKGRTGTLVCAILMLFYSVSIKEANFIFQKRRMLYDIGVKVEAQLAMLKYWEILISDRQANILFSKFMSIKKKWSIQKLCIIDKSNSHGTRLHNVKIKQILKCTQNCNCYTLKSLQANKTITINYEIADDVCLEVECNKFITRSFSSFSFNCVLEMIINNGEQNEKLELRILWQNLDGIKGTSLKGKQYFDEILIHLVRKD